MVPSELEKHTTNEEVLESILATLNRLELLLSQQNHPRPSGLSEDIAHDFGDEERRSDIEEEKNERQSGKGEEGESGVEGGGQEDGNEAGSKSQGEDNKSDERNDERESNAENGHQRDNNVSNEGNHERQSDAEGVGRRAVQSYFADMVTGPVMEVIRFGDEIPPNPIFPILFKQSFLERFELDMVKRRVKAIATFSNAVSQLHGLARVHIIDSQVLNYEDRSDKLPNLMCKSLNSLDSHASNEIKLPGDLFNAKDRL